MGGGIHFSISHPLLPCSLIPFAHAFPSPPTHLIPIPPYSPSNPLPYLIDHTCMYNIHTSLIFWAYQLTKNGSGITEGFGDSRGCRSSLIMRCNPIFNYTLQFYPLPYPPPRSRPCHIFPFSYPVPSLPFKRGPWSSRKCSENGILL